MNEGERVEPLEPHHPTSVGDVRLLARLGAGGMGEVFLGQTPDGARVAVKLVHERLAGDRTFRARFRREVDAARRVAGTGTAAVLAAAPDAERPWLATEFVKGPTLLDRVRDGGPLPADELRALAAGVARALVAIHAAGVVHRDLKPSNVILATDGPRLIDFGIAAAAEATALTSTGLVLGSPGYMSPEQALGGGEVGPASDVFSVGALLSYAATGEPPFGTGATAAQVYRIVHQEPDLSGVADDRVRGLIAGCLAKDPAARPDPDTLLAIAEGRTDFPSSQGDTTELREPGAPEPTAPTGSSRRGLVPLAVAGAVLLVVAGAGVWIALRPDPGQAAAPAPSSSSPTAGASARPTASGPTASAGASSTASGGATPAASAGGTAAGGTASGGTAAGGTAAGGTAAGGTAAGGADPPGVGAGSDPAPAVPKPHTWRGRFSVSSGGFTMATDAYLSCTPGNTLNTWKMTKASVATDPRFHANRVDWAVHFTTGEYRVLWAAGGSASSEYDVPDKATVGAGTSNSAWGEYDEWRSSLACDKAPTALANRQWWHTGSHVDGSGSWSRLS